MPLSEQVLGGFKSGMSRSSRRGGKDGAQKLYTLQNGYITDQGDAVPRPGLQHVANVANSAGLYGADSQLHVFHGGAQGFVNPNNSLIQPHILRYPLSQGAATYDPTITNSRFLLVAFGDTTNYSAPGFDDSSWASGLMPLANQDRPDAPLYGFPAAVATYWPSNQNVWFRGKFNLTTASDQTLYIYLDDGADVYINGVLVFSHNHGSGPQYFWTQTILASFFVAGENTIAVKARNDIFGVNNYLCFRLEPQGSDQIDPIALNVKKIHFTGLILGKIYVAAEFARGLIRHFWLQEPAPWQPNHIYGLGELVQPSVPDGYYYQANTKGNSPAWAAGQPKSIGDVVQPTTPNGWEYVVTDATGNAVTGDTEPSWPTSEGATVFEGTDSVTIPSTSGTVTNGSADSQVDQSIKDRYDLGGGNS